MPQESLSGKWNNLSSRNFIKENLFFILQKVRYSRVAHFLYDVALKTIFIQPMIVLHKYRKQIFFTIFVIHNK
jgi:hypothetical protein